MALRFARAILTRYAGVGGIQPSCLAIPRSSRLAQCSMITPSSIRNQCDWVIAQGLFVGGKTVSTAPSAVYTAHAATWRPVMVEFTATRSPPPTA